MPDESKFVELHRRYESAQRRSAVFMVVSIVLGLGLVGSLAFHFVGGDGAPLAVHGTSQHTLDGGSGGIRMGPGSGGGMMHRGSGGSGMRINIENFFNTDGSVNQTLVQQFNANISSAPDPNAAMVQMAQEIDSAVASGAITQAQATQLKAALDIG